MKYLKRLLIVIYAFAGLVICGMGLVGGCLPEKDQPGVCAVIIICLVIPIGFIFREALMAHVDWLLKEEREKVK